MASVRSARRLRFECGGQLLQRRARETTPTESASAPASPTWTGSGGAGPAPVSGALRVACRCAGSPLSSVVAPRRWRFAPGPFGRWWAVELVRRALGREPIGREQSERREPAIAVRDRGRASVGHGSRGQRSEQRWAPDRRWAPDGRSAPVRRRAPVGRGAIRRAAIGWAAVECVALQRPAVRVPRRLGRTIAVGLVVRSSIGLGRSNDARAAIRACDRVGLGTTARRVHRRHRSTRPWPGRRSAGPHQLGRGATLGRSVGLGSRPTPLTSGPARCDVRAGIGALAGRAASG